MTALGVSASISTYLCSWLAMESSIPDGEPKCMDIYNMSTDLTWEGRESDLGKRGSLILGISRIQPPDMSDVVIQEIALLVEVDALRNSVISSIWSMRPPCFFLFVSGSRGGVRDLSLLSPRLARSNSRRLSVPIGPEPDEED